MDQRLFGVLDRALDRLQLLRNLGAWPPLFEEGVSRCHENEILTCTCNPLIFAGRLPPVAPGQPSVQTAVNKLLYQTLAMIALVFGEDARAADSLTTSRATRDTKAPSDAPAKAAPLPSDWTGFYVGAHAGVSSGYSAWSATQPGGAGLSGSLNFFTPYDVFNGHGSHFAGVSGGYNYALPSRLVAGLEADVSFPGFLGASQSFSSAVIGSANYEDTVNMFGSVRGRIGYDANPWLYYATGGLAWTYDKFTRTQFGAGPVFGAPAGTVETSFAGRVGWTVGAGVEAPIVPGWTAKIEYLYSQFGTSAVTFPLGGQKFESDLSMHQVRLGLNYKLGDQLKPD